MTVVVCGFNEFGQCCNLIHTNGNCCTHVITQLTESLKDDIIDLSFSWSSILAISGSGTTLCGYIDGKDTCITIRHPEKISITQGSCARSYCIFITEDGRCWRFDPFSKSWKDLTNHILAENEGTKDSNVLFTKVSCGETMVIALSSLGVAYNIPNVLSPPQLKVKDIACGREHGLLITESGSVFAWGGGSRGQLGTGDLGNSEELCEVTALSGMYIVHIAAGGWHSCAVTKEGALYTWGWNKQGQLGHPRLEESKAGVAVLAEPRFVDWPENIEVSVELVACGARHTVVKLVDNTVWACGWNKWGQLGNSGISSVSHMTRVPCSENLSIRKIVCGAWNTGLLVSKKSVKLQKFADK